LDLEETVAGRSLGFGRAKKAGDIVCGMVGKDISVPVDIWNTSQQVSTFI
jgi:hypothetical protein